MTAFKTKSAVAAGHQCAVTASGPSLATARFGQPLAVVDHAAGVSGVIGVLPSGCVPAYVVVSAPALGAGFKASIGLRDPATGAISVLPQDGGGAWVADDTTGAAGGVKQVMTPAMYAVQPSDEDRDVLLVVDAAGDAAGLFTLVLAYHNA